MSSPSSPQLPGETRRKLSTWIPLAAFVGTSFALAIPIFALARQRKNILRKSLHHSNAAPPRRSVTPVPGRLAAKPNPVTSGTSEAKIEFSSPAKGELLSAVSNVDLSTAFYAGKAFAIATGIVTVGGVALTLGVKSMMGVEDTKEFAEKMRMLIWRGMPGLTSQIHRPPDVDAEDSVVPHSLEPDPTWKWEEAEKRLRVAYDDGGFPAWIQLAVKEMEDELKVERARRQRQFDHSQTKSLS